MTEKNKFEKGSSNLSNKKTKKGNSWKHQMYELEIAIAKESNNKAVLGICFLLVLAVFGYFIWNSYNSENMSYTSSWIQERVIESIRS